MLGMRALYHEGWLATTLHPPISGWSHFDADVWELYDLRDRPQPDAQRCGASIPTLLEQLKGLWFYYAGVYKGLPLDDRSALEIISSPRPQPSEPRDRYIYYPGTAESPSRSPSTSGGRSYTIAAAVDDRHPRGGRACCSPTAASAAGTPSTSKTAGCTTSTTGSGSASRRQLGDADPDRARTC